MPRAVAETVISPVPGALKRRKVHKRHGYFIFFTAIFALLVVAGFSRTFFLPAFRGTFDRPIIVHIHGALFFGWTALLLIQATLAAVGRLRFHRRVGSLAGWLILPMVVIGSVVAARDTVHDYLAGEGEGALSFFYGELADLAMFGLLAGGAMLLRNRPDYHKRWVIMGSLGLLGAAIGRIPEISAFGLHIFLGMIASVFAYDIMSRRNLHPATLIGTAVLLVLNLTEEAIGDTQVWLNFSHRLLRV
jgi:hypothetical protein